MDLYGKTKEHTHTHTHTHFFKNVDITVSSMQEVNCLFSLSFSKYSSVQTHRNPAGYHLQDKLWIITRSFNLFFKMSGFQGTIEVSRTKHKNLISPSNLVWKSSKSKMNQITKIEKILTIFEILAGLILRKRLDPLWLSYKKSTYSLFSMVFPRKPMLLLFLILSYFIFW